MSKKNQPQEVSLKAKVLGRVGTNLEIGIVGLPNVGKSSFFNGMLLVIEREIFHSPDVIIIVLV